MRITRNFDRRNYSKLKKIQMRLSKIYECNENFYNLEDINVELVGKRISIGITNRSNDKIRPAMRKPLCTTVSPITVPFNP